MTLKKKNCLIAPLHSYAEDDIGAQFEYDNRRVRVFGGRPLGDNRSIRFNIAYAVPWNCDVNNLKGIFQGEIYSVIMPKVTLYSEVSDQNSPKNSTVESQKQVDETLTLPKATSDDSMPQKGEEGVSQDAKNQTEERFEKGEKKRVDREESENASASGKPLPQEGKKELPVIDEKSFMTKSGENGVGEGKENVKVNSELGDIGSTQRKGIKEVAAYASHAVTSLVNSFNEEEKMLLYTTATVLVLALGVYASYRLRS
ncbi:Protein RESTRICTED TEV MOVEMENT 2, partial [Mucuna pruriens]